MSNRELDGLPLGLKVAAAYLIVFGAIRLLGALFDAVFIATRLTHWSTALIFQQSISFALRIAGAALVFYAGIALLERKQWSRRLAFGAFAVVTYFFVTRAAMLWALGKPAFALGIGGTFLVLTAVMFFLFLKNPPSNITS